MFSARYAIFSLEKEKVDILLEDARENGKGIPLHSSRLGELRDSLTRRGYSFLESKETYFDLPLTIIIGKQVRYVSDNCEDTFTKKVERLGLPYSFKKEMRGTFQKNQTLYLNQRAHF